MTSFAPGFNIKDKLRKSSLKMIRENLTYFGIISSQFKLIVENHIPENIIGYVEFDKKTGSHIGRSIHLNEYWLKKPDFDYNHLTYVRLHELLHILNKHGLRMGDRDFQIWNVACEHVLEAWMKNELSGVVQPYSGEYHMLDDLEKALPRCTVEQAYEWLNQNKNFYKIEDNGDGTLTVTDNHGNKWTIKPNDKDDNDLEKKTAIEQMVAEARALLETMKHRGTMSAGIQEYLDKILSVEVPWNSMLERAIKKWVSMEPDGRAWHIPNKYYVPLGMYLPGPLYSEKSEVFMLIVGADSSGSISTKNLKQFAGIIKDSMKYFSQVQLYVHDVNVQQDIVFEKEREADLYSFIKNIGFKGRGGTSHDPVFEKIEELYEENADSISMAIFLTDGHSDIGSICKKYNWLKVTPTFFLITSDGTEPNLPENYGKMQNIKINTT